MRKIINFLLKFFGFYLLWLLLEEYLPEKYQWFETYWYYPKSFILDELMFFTTNILSKGLNLSISILSSNQFLIENSRIVEIGIPCFGDEAMYFFAVFIISYPGYYKNKIYFILIGVFLINLLNIIRLVSLSLIFYYYPEYVDFNHHFLFNFIVYTAIFSIWIIWIRYFSNIENKDLAQNEIIPAN